MIQVSDKNHVRAQSNAFLVHYIPNLLHVAFRFMEWICNPHEIIPITSVPAGFLGEILFWPLSEVQRLFKDSHHHQRPVHYHDMTHFYRRQAEDIAHGRLRLADAYTHVSQHPRPKPHHGFKTWAGYRSFIVRWHIMALRRIGSDN